MENAEHRDAVLAELRRALAGDRMKMTVNGFTQLGLVEMTRKRTRESLAHVLCEPCPTCSGTGQIKTARTICYEILRELLREARQFNPREFRVLASQTVIDLFLEEESQSLAALGDFIGKPISLQRRVALHAGAVRHHPDVRSRSRAPAGQRNRVAPSSKPPVNDVPIVRPTSVPKRRASRSPRLCFSV